MNTHVSEKGNFNAEGVVNQEWFERMASTRKDFLKRMFAVFLEEEPKRMQKTREAIDERDFKTLAYLAHSMKGATSTLGASRTSMAAAKLEVAAKEKDLSGAEEYFVEMTAEFGRLVDFMQAFMASG